MTNPDENREDNTSDETAQESSVPEHENESATGEADAEQPDTESAEIDEDDLPEWEPLTPEIVEEEAIRGDFVMRWAVVLMAFLMAFTPIRLSQSESLVHIKSGERLLANGFLPDGQDHFSYTLEEQPWHNLNWLFDLTAGGLHSTLGPWALTAFKALLVAFAFAVVVHTSVTNVSTWWTSICAAMALVACWPRFGLTPDIVTLCGLALTLFLLHQWNSRPESAFPWQFPVLFAVWANLDSRMFLGIVLLVLYAIGRLFGSGKSERGIGQLWSIIAASVVASLLNPSLFRSLLAPIQIYGAEYPGGRLYHVASTGENFHYYPFWEAFSRIDSGFSSALFAFVLFAAACTMMALNRRRLDTGHVAASFGFLALGLLTSHELAAASVVLAVVASLNGQHWYYNNFKQEYTVELGELIFSRGGRAVTVLGMFAIALFFVSGRMKSGTAGDSGVGLGFADELQTAIDGMQADLSEIGPDEKIFHLTASQGDLMIWNDRPSFVDSRFGLFNSGGVLKTHDATRRAIRRPRQEFTIDPASTETPPEASPEERREIWTRTLEKYGVDLIMPRMYGRSPDTHSLADLNLSDDWTLTHLGSAAALFSRRPEDAKNAQDFIELAFRSKPPKEHLTVRTDWPREPSFYENYLFTPQTPWSTELLEARNYRTQYSAVKGAPEETLAERVALTLLSIRKATISLVDEPQNAEALRVLGTNYLRLMQLEDVIAGEDSFAPKRLRYLQAISALNLAKLVDPDDLQSRQLLTGVYHSEQRPDLALASVEELITMSTRLGTGLNLDAMQQFIQLRDTLRDQLEPTFQRIDDTLAAMTDDDEARHKAAFAGQLYQSDQLVLRPLELLGDEQDMLTADLVTRNFRANLQLEAGRIEDAWTSFQQLQGIAEANKAEARGIGWQTPTAITNIANGDYARARLIWSKQASSLDETVAPLYMGTLPLSMQPERWLTAQNAMLMQGVDNTPGQSANLHVQQGLCYLEEGYNELAADEFETALRLNPMNLYYRLATFYATQIRGKELDLGIEHSTDDWTEIEDGLLTSAYETSDGKWIAVEDELSDNETAMPSAFGAPLDSKPTSATAAETKNSSELAD